MTCYTYILYSRSLGCFYIGFTKDIDQRLAYHNAGYEAFTRKGVPWILLWYAHKPTKGEAMMLEKKLKNLSHKRLVDFMLKYQQDLEVDIEFFGGFEP